MKPDDDAISFADYLRRLRETAPDRAEHLERITRRDPDDDTEAS